MNLLTENDLVLIKQHLQGDGVLAYPTEAVFGLGCDPSRRDAIDKILLLKQRPIEKGVILVASSYTQVADFVADEAIPVERRAEIFSSWPGPTTWLLPKAKGTPNWITGDSDYIAIRITAHPIVRQICEFLQMPLVSTSANPATLAPAETVEQVKQYFNGDVFIIDKPLGNSHRPSVIKHSTTGQVLRA